MAILWPICQRARVKTNRIQIARSIIRLQEHFRAFFNRYMAILHFWPQPDTAKAGCSRPQPAAAGQLRL